MSKKIEVRLAHPKDCVNVFNLLKQGWTEQTVEYAPVNDLRGFQWILACIDLGVVAVADLNGRIVGAAGGTPFQPPWSKRWIFDLEFFFVLEKFRKEGVDKALLRGVEGWADAHMLSITFGIQTGDRPDVKDRMMKMNGWTYVGGNFLRPYDGRKQDQDTSGVDNPE